MTTPTLPPDLDERDWAPPARGPRTRVAIGEAVRRNLLVIALPVILLMAAALAWGLNRPPNYTAEARLGIARVDVSAPGALAGFAVAAQSLAEAYSRALSAEAVSEAVAKRVKSTPARVDQQLTSVPIPDTPVFRVVATARDGGRAVELANIASEELISYLVALNRESPDAARLYAEYKRASLKLSQDQERRDTLQAAVDKTPTASLRRRLVQARADYASSRLQAGGLEQSYLASTQGQASTSLLQTLSKASTFRSDRSSKLQIALFLALVAGLAIGVALAVLRTTRLMRRSMS